MLKRTSFHFHWEPSEKRWKCLSKKYNVRYQNCSLAKKSHRFICQSNWKTKCAWNYREQTVLPSKERVNKGTKRMNSLPLSTIFIPMLNLRDFTGKTAAYKSCVTLLLNLYLHVGFSALGKNFFGLYFYRVSTSVLSRMPFSDWVRYSRSILWYIVSSVVAGAGCCFFGFSKCPWSGFRWKFWTTSRFILKQLDYSLSISMRDSWLGLRPRQLSRDRNLELIV